MSSPSIAQSCLWTVTRWVPLVQQKLLTFIRAHVFTQPCSILSLNSDTMCAPSAAETSYLYQSTWAHPALFNLVIEQWHDGAPSAAETSYLTFITAHEVTQPCSILSLNSDTMCAPSTTETSYLYHSTWVQFTQPCSILSLNSDAMCAPSAAETSYLDQSTWVHSALFNLLFEQWHDGCP